MAAISRLASVRAVGSFLALFSLKAQEIDVPLAWMGRRAAESELAYVFPEGKRTSRCV